MNHHIQKNDIKRIVFLISICALLLTIENSCKKLIDIPPPVGTLIASQTFSTDEQAESAAAGMYFDMINTYQCFSNMGMSVFTGFSADELAPFDQSNLIYAPFYRNNLNSSNDAINSGYWTKAYAIIYRANSIIEGLNNFKGVSDPVKNELTGEAEFTRALCNFYLVNMFGDVPLVTTINYHKTSALPKVPAVQVYQAIIADLLDAQQRLPADYSSGQGQRIVPNKWAATALLARVYLFYNRDYKDAEIQASNVIGNTSLFSLSDSLNHVFSTNSPEAIWQLQQSNVSGNRNATPEGLLLIPDLLNGGRPPFAYLSKTLLAAYEPGDQRKTAWVDSTIYQGMKYYFPYKYKIGDAQAIAGAPYTEYYMVLRLAEQYLIRAEAEANGAGSGLNGAINDLNIIRRRAGLPDYSGTMDQTSVLTALAHENQIEFFAEWGHRWLDLKRTGKAVAVLSLNKGFIINPNSLLYPIPISELITDPNLTQNPGY